MTTKPSLRFHALTFLCMLVILGIPFTANAKILFAPLLQTAPAVTIVEFPIQVGEGSIATGNGSFTDEDGGSWTATVDYYGDGSEVLPLTLDPDNTFDLNHTYPDEGNFTVIVTVTDTIDGLSDDASVGITVDNVAPVVSAGDDMTINEGATFNSSGSFTDPGDDTWTGTVNYGDGSVDQILTLATEKTFDLSNVYPQDGIYTVTVTVSDGLDSDDDTVQVTVNNLAPNAEPDSIEVLEGGTATTLEESSETSLLANDTDPGTNDVLTLTTTPISGPSNGGLILNSNGTFSYTHNGSETTSDSFTYQVCDDGITPLCDTALVTISIIPVNDPPSIEDIPDALIQENTSTDPIEFEIGDVETPVTNLSVTASSSNTILVPDANIAHGGSDANRTITITPAPNQSGTTVITVTVTDGSGGSASDTFTLDVNASPTIQDIPNKFISEDTSTGPIELEISDVETPAVDLDVTASSSDTTLVPDANIAHGGSGANRTVTITPALDQSGTTVITITVTDENGGSASDTFTLTVNAVNDLPTISIIPDKTIPEDTSTGLIPFTIGDVETPVANLTITTSSNNTTLVPNANIVKGGSGADRTLTITPAANQNGSAVITVTVSDGSGGNASDSFTLTVTPVNDAPIGLSEAYEVNLGSTLTVPAPGVLGNDSDPEGDTLTAEKLTDPTHGTLSFNSNGSFTYTPTGSYIGEDTFTYQAKDPGGLTSSPVEVVITVKDASSPSVVWLEPVTDGNQKDVFGEVVLLKVDAIDDVSVDYVRFYRWDPSIPPAGEFVDIGIDEEAPFEFPISTSVLNYEWNQIFARAYDDTGNESGRKFIWLYRLPPTEYLFIPLAAKQ